MTRVTPTKYSQLSEAFMFPLLLVWTNGWTNRRLADGLRCHEDYVTSLLWKINYQARCTCSPTMTVVWFEVNDIHMLLNVLNGNICLSIRISLTLVPIGPIDNIPALMQIMACRLPAMDGIPTHVCVTPPEWVKMIMGILIVAESAVWLLRDGLVSIGRQGICNIYFHTWRSIYFRANSTRWFTATKVIYIFYA